MKRHKTIDNDELIDKLCDEVNKASDVRYLSLIPHLYIEYYLNELISLKFDKAELILDKIDLGSFYNKFLILRALGIFKQNDKLIKNIELITRIRNFYAHNLLISNRLPEENKSRIKQLVYLDDEGNESDYDVPWAEHVDEYMTQLQVCAVSTINVLQRMVWDLEGLNYRNHEHPP